MLAYYYYNKRNISKNIIYLAMVILFCILIVNQTIIRNDNDMEFVFALLSWIIVSLSMTISVDELYSLEHNNNVSKSVCLYKGEKYLVYNVLGTTMIKTFIFSVLSLVLLMIIQVSSSVFQIDIFSSYKLIIYIIKAILLVPAISLFTMIDYAKISNNKYIRNIVRVAINFMFLAIILSTNQVVYFVLFAVLNGLMLYIIANINKILKIREC